MTIIYLSSKFDIRSLKDATSVIMDLIEVGSLINAQHAIDQLSDENPYKNFYQINLYRNQHKLFEGYELVQHELQKFAKSVIADFKDISVTRLYLNLLGEKAYLEFLLGKYATSLETLAISIKQFQKLSEDTQSQLNHELIFFEFTKGNVLLYKGDVEAAMTILKDLRNRLDPTKEKRLLGFVLNDIGDIYHRRGDLSKAIEYFNQSLLVKEDVGNPIDIAFSFNNLGSIYYEKGDLEEAKSLLERSLMLFRDRGNLLDAAFANDLLGLISFAMNDEDKAFTYLNTGLDLRKQSTNEVLMATSYIHLITACLSINQTEKARSYLPEMEEIANHSSSDIPKLYYHYALAIVYKMTPTMEAKVKAKQEFLKIITDATVNYQIVFSSMCHLCDLYLEEFTIFQNQETLNKAEEMIQKIVSHAKSTNSSIKMIESLILESKFELLDGKYEIAINILEHASLIANEQKLSGIEKRVNSELKAIENELEDLKNIMERNSNLIDRVVNLGVKDYIQHVGSLFYPRIGDSN